MSPDLDQMTDEELLQLEASLDEQQPEQQPEQQVTWPQFQQP